MAHHLRLKKFPNRIALNIWDPTTYIDQPLADDMYNASLYGYTAFWCTCIHIYEYIDVYIYIYMCVCVCICICICIYIYILSKKDDTPWERSGVPLFYPTIYGPIPCSFPSTHPPTRCNCQPKQLNKLATWSRRVLATSMRGTQQREFWRKP